jgi:hypothetical protein
LLSEFRVVMFGTISAYKTMFGSSLPPVVCGIAYLRQLCSFEQSGVQHILCGHGTLYIFLI